MANLCGYRIPNSCLYTSLIICLAISIVISSTQLMQLNLDRIAANVDVRKIYDDVYHSEEIFRINYAEMEKKLKIYIYPQGKKCSNYEDTFGNYASEGYFFKNIRESNFSTDDPDQALLFFIPISLQRLHQKELSYEEVGKKAEKCVKNLIIKYPYWNRTLGADHFILTCLDYDVHIPILVKNTIRIVCSSTYDSDASRFIPHKDISLPSVMKRFYKPSRGNDLHKRQILGFWAGVCNSDTRKRMVDIWGDDVDLNIQNTTVHVQGRMKNVYRAKFCICPVGSRITNSRITLAIHHGCVPVIIDDYLDLPFHDILDWEKFSVVLRERDVFVLKGILSIIGADDYTRMYTNLMEVKKHFEWNTPPVKYDAFHMVMYDLWLRRHLVKY
ncbi:hypothetical protein ACS0TY_002909 [Phlomoides rotata]